MEDALGEYILQSSEYQIYRVVKSKYITYFNRKFE